MDEEKTFWIRIWIIVGVCFIFLTGGVTSCTMYESIIIKDMVKNGVDPVAARCAIGSLSTDLCAMYFADKK